MVISNSDLKICCSVCFDKVSYMIKLVCLSLKTLNH